MKYRINKIIEANNKSIAEMCEQSKLDFKSNQRNYQMKSETKLLIIFLIVIALFYFIPTAAHSETIDSEYLPYIQEMCAIHNFPLEITIAVAIVESNIQMVVSTENSNGSKDIGIFQLNSRYIKYFEEEFWYKEKSFNPYDPYDNIEMGILILRNLYVQTKQYDLAVRAFNTGLHALAYDPDRSNEYLIKVINIVTTLRLETH